jgi:hypothetical protein
VRADQGPREGREGECDAAKQKRSFERIWTSTSVDTSKSVLPVAGSARFHRRERVQDYGPHASRSRAKGA